MKLQVKFKKQNNYKFKYPALKKDFSLTVTCKKSYLDSKGLKI